MYTFYVKDWDKQPSKEVKVFLKDYYGNKDLPLEHEEECHSHVYGAIFDKEAQRYYIMERVYENEFPTVEINEIMLSNIISSIHFPLNDGGGYSGEIDFTQLSVYIKKVLFLLNSVKGLNSLVIPAEKTKNFIFAGADQDRYERKLKEILNLLQFARKNKKSVYWG